MLGSGFRYNDFRDLEVWEHCRQIRLKIWAMCKVLPRNEIHRLSDQVIRASRSATANIAEGYGRFHYQENIQFCRQARGSLYELIDHLTVTEDCKYMEQDNSAAIIEEVKSAIIVLNGYIRYLKKRKETVKSSNR
jgi:four helix bundle protein